MPPTEDATGRPDATALAAAVRAGEVSPREVAEAAIHRIEARNPALNAVIEDRFDQALAEADSLPDGPLRGVPILVKSLAADVAGLRTTRGSRLFADDVKERDSELVRRYRAAGLLVLGMTNTPELGKSGSTEPVLHGPTHNPWRSGHSTGGSSGGSAAAVASGMVPVAHGNDGGGSIRIPSSMCGLLGLKPSRGLVPDAPYALAFSSPVAVQHALTATVRDSAALLDVAAGPVPGDAYSTPRPEGGFVAAARRDPGRLRVGLMTEVRNGPATDPACIAAARRAAGLLAELGHEVDEIEAPFDFGRVIACSSTIMAIDLVSSVSRRLDELGRELRDDDIEPFSRLLMDFYGGLGPADCATAYTALQQQGWEVAAAFGSVDLLLSPTVGLRVPPHGLLDTTRPETVFEHGTRFSAWTTVFNVTGMPAVSVPMGLDDGGLPVGAQLAAPLGSDALLLQVAAQLEAAAPWPLVAPGWED